MLLSRLSAPAVTVAPSRVRWDDAPCPLCGDEAGELVLEAQDPAPLLAGRPDPSPENGLMFAVVRCTGCGLHYTNPRPDADSIGAFYPADYKPHRRPRKMRQSISRPLLARLFGRPVPERRGLMPMHGEGRLLDFGCGGGSYMARMADQGWRVTGLDAAVGAVRTVQMDLGLTAVAGTLPHPDLAPCSFDVVTMWHSLEHVHDPLTILREAFQLLVPGGKLIVACPNMAGFAYRWFGATWFGLDLPRHLVHFTPESLAEILLAAGFRVENQRQIRHSDWLRSSAKLATRSGTAAPWQRLLTWKPLAKLTAWLAYLCGGSDCMMAIAVRPA